MLTNIQVRGVIGKIGIGSSPRGRVLNLNVASNIYKYNRAQDKHIQEGTIWTRFAYLGTADLKVGMPVEIVGHLDLSQDPRKHFNMIADKVYLDIEAEKTKEYYSNKKNNEEEEVCDDSF